MKPKRDVHDLLREMMRIGDALERIGKAIDAERGSVARQLSELERRI